MFVQLIFLGEQADFVSISLVQVSVSVGQISERIFQIVIQTPNWHAHYFLGVFSQKNVSHIKIQNGGHSVIFLALLVYLWIFLPNFDEVNSVSCIFDDVEFNSG